MRNETQLREEIIWVCRNLAKRGLIAATDGNVSCRLEQDLLLITPSGKAKGDLDVQDLLVVDLQGRIVAGQGTASSEIKMHLLVYEKRSDVFAVVHAHPPLLTAFTLAGIPFASQVLPEVWLTVGAVPTAPYATPSTEEVPRSIAPFLEKNQAVLLERHGSLTVGKTPKEAFMRLEKLEHAAHTLLYAHLLSGRLPAPLSHPDLRKLERAFAALSATPHK